MMFEGSVLSKTLKEYVLTTVRDDGGYVGSVFVCVRGGADLIHRPLVRVDIERNLVLSEHVVRAKLHKEGYVYELFNRVSVMSVSYAPSKDVVQSGKELQGRHVWHELTAVARKP